jgi:hypothetical protein
VELVEGVVMQTGMRLHYIDPSLSFIFCDVELSQLAAPLAPRNSTAGCVPSVCSVGWVRAERR